MYHLGIVVPDMDEALATRLDEAVRFTKKDGWRGNAIKERELRIAVRAVLGGDPPDEQQVTRAMELIRNQAEY